MVVRPNSRFRACQKCLQLLTCSLLVLTQNLLCFSDELGDDESDEAFMWLLSNTHPWDEVSDKWNETSLRRKKHLNASSRIYDYVQKFPCLGLDEGWKLVSHI